MNQISETSSRAYIECSFTSFDKKKKSRHKDKSPKNSNLISAKTKKLSCINEAIHSSVNNSSNNINNNKTQSLKLSPSSNNEIKFPEQRAFIFAKSVSRGENNYELRMFSSEANIYGKPFNQIIRANSYKSNIC